MSEQENASSSAEDTTSSEAVETQGAADQAVDQADTTQSDDQVTASLKIEEAAVDDNTEEPSQPTIDDIVGEALSGELSEETQKLIEENGLGKHIDMLVAGHQAIQEKNNQEIFSVVGGDKAYAELQEWGKHNMSKEEQGAFNEALFSGNLNLAKLAVQGLNAQYIAKNGKAPELVLEGGGSANESNRPFSSQAEYLQATQTQEYKHNPEARRAIEAKRNQSGF